MAVIIGSSLAFIDGTVVNAALPAIQREFDTNVAGAQWVIGIGANYWTARALTYWPGNDGVTGVSSAGSRVKVTASVPAASLATTTQGAKG